MMIPINEAHLVPEDQPIRGSVQTSVQNAQALVRKYIPASRELSQELMQERRLEALSEYCRLG
ncbi:hypothetical protein [Anabaena sp. CA = ATCC 33047]|nr:hypothetical protein [Anabaena sp. CA = ATCC 33047]